jgi:hypothetical protein
MADGSYTNGRKLMAKRLSDYFLSLEENTRFYSPQDLENARRNFVKLNLDGNLRSACVDGVNVRSLKD